MREMLFIKLALSCLVEGNRIHPVFPISTLPVRTVIRQRPCRLKLGSPWPPRMAARVGFDVPVTFLVCFVVLPSCAA